MTGRSFYRDGLPAEQALRLALSHSVTASGKDHRMIAAALDMSPSQFSRAMTTTPHDDSHQRANFPPEKLCLFIEETRDLSWVLTLLDYLGYSSHELEQIRRPVKTDLQVREELLTEAQALRKAADRMAEQLTLTAPEPGTKRRKR